ncbi:protein of unknown function [Rhodovastum atsumiense]|nr:protein of unknown function [Rhodovastum atsumiense]
MPRARPGGSASWTSAKGFALGTHDFCAAQRTWDPRALWPSRDRVRAHDGRSRAEPWLFMHGSFTAGPKPL